jgi:hypothetical protein
VGTSGKTGRPPGSRTSGARDRWKNVVTIEEHPKDANDTIWRPERSQGLLEGSTGRDPKQRLFILRVGRDGGNLSG